MELKYLLQTGTHTLELNSNTMWLYDVETDDNIVSLELIDNDTQKSVEKKYSLNSFKTILKNAIKQNLIVSHSF